MEKLPAIRADKLVSLHADAAMDCATAEYGSVYERKETLDAARDNLIEAFNAQTARIAELEAALRVMTDVFHPRSGLPGEQMYVETMAYQKAISALEATDETES